MDKLERKFEIENNELIEPENPLSKLDINSLLGLPYDPYTASNVFYNLLKSLEKDYITK